VGDEPVLINEVAANFESWDAYKKKIEFHAGPAPALAGNTRDLHGETLRSRYKRGGSISHDCHK